MPSYDYEIIKTGEIIEVQQSIKDDHLTELFSPKLKKNSPCKRIISRNLAGIIFSGDGWTVKSSGHGKRGYRGRFNGLVREAGSPVTCPAEKKEADRFFQSQVDNGMLDHVPATMNFAPGTKPITAAEMVDKKNKTK